MPAWTQVGKHMRWEPKMEALAHGFIKGAFGLSPQDPFPSVGYVFSPTRVCISLSRHHPVH